MSIINKKSYKDDLIKAIKQSEYLEKELVSKSKAHQFLNTARGENKILLVNLLAYLSGKNLLYKGVAYSEDFFIQQLILTHRASLQSIHVAMEQCFKQIISDKKLGKVEPKINKKYDEIIKSLPDESLTNKIEKLKQKYPYFMDYLEKILDGVKDNSFKKKIRSFFNGLNIVRNKLSHSPDLSGQYQLTEHEVKILTSSGLKNLVAQNNGIRFGVQFYDIIFQDLRKLLNLFYD